MKRWWFSLVLTTIYLAVFNLWFVLSRSWVVASGVIAGACLMATFRLAQRHGFFANVWDGLLHLTVILDILLEAVLIPTHHAKGFYLCALAFALVVGGYRFYCLKRNWIHI